MIHPEVHTVRCTSPVPKKVKNLTFSPTLTFTILIEDSPIQRRGDWPQESVQKFDCKMPRYNIFCIDTEPSHLSQTFCCINSQSELFSSYNTIQTFEILKCFHIILRNISKSLASNIFQVCNATQLNVLHKEFENFLKKKVFFELTQNKQNF